MELLAVLGIAIVVLLYLLSQHFIFARLIKQNSDLLIHADERLAQANEMVLMLSKTSSEVSNSMREMKDLMVHIESVYNARLDCVTKNRNDIMDAYTKLLTQFEELRHRHEAMMDDSYHTMRELARRPTLTNNNN